MKPGRWWQVIDPEGRLWCETSREDEARAFMRQGDTLYRLWHETVEEWRYVEGR